jgi:murein DD-endopeptidase MepM/ murein hydrolase activator NlpD
MLAGTVVHAYYPQVLADESQLTASPSNPEIETKLGNSTPGSALLPEFNLSLVMDAIAPIADFHTIAPTRPRETALNYTVTQGDSIFSIAKDYNIKPETILWANYDVLKDNPDTISINQVLVIPPTDGVYYQWGDGDTPESVAAHFKAKVDNILSYPGNGLDMTNPVIKAGEYVMIPGGSREFQQWLIPTIPRGKAGVAVNVIGPGSCDTSTGGNYGTGTFIWPAGNHYLSGNEYAPWHLGIDIAAGSGSPVYAADSGLVVYSGWSNQGYGNMIMIDHGNGYQTLYAHLSVLFVSCGQGVFQGEGIAQSGSTGNSTGPHLHFEVRYMGGFINPWDVLP